MADLDKIVEQLSELTVLEASELVSKLEESWGVSAAAPVAAVAGVAPAGDGASAEAEEEKSEFGVIIKDPGPKKIDTIKVVRQLTGLGLKESKELAETADSKVLEAASKDAANEAKAKLEEAGAVVELA